MAFTSTLLERSVFGNKAVQVYSVTADGAEGTVATGLKSVSWITYAPSSMATAAAHLKLNVLTSGTAAAGYIAVTGVANGDIFYLTVFGS